MVYRRTEQSDDWAEIIDRLVEGDQLACLRISRLITELLARWRAYDFRDEWPDLVQEVLLVVFTAAREGKIRNPDAGLGFIRTVAHHKFIDRLRRRIRCSEDQSLPWDELIRAKHLEAESRRSAEESFDLRLALEKLPEQRRRIVLGVYGEGKTVAKMAQETGTPLGTTKRYLRVSLAELREDLESEMDSS